MSPQVGVYHRWENPTSERYYQADLLYDLLGNWVLRKAWGSKHTAKGGGSQVLCLNYAQGLSLLKKVAALRQTRGYVMMDEYKAVKRPVLYLQ